MKKYAPLFSLIVFLFSLLASSCEYGSPSYLYSGTPVEKRASNITTLGAQDLPQLTVSSKYSFLILTDMHFGTERKKRGDETFLLEFQKLLSDSDQSLRPQFIVNIGDTMNSGKKSEAEEFNVFCEKLVQTAKTELGVSDYKIYSALGNHDIYNNGWKVWKENIWPGSSFYKFTLKGFSFYFLDSANGTLGSPQFESIEKDFKADSSPKLVFCHYPLYADGTMHFVFDDVMERNRIISILGKYNVRYFFSGHLHPSGYITDFKNFKEAVQKSYIFNRVFSLVTVDPSSQSVEYRSFRY